MKLNVNIIVTHSTPGAQAAKEATSTTPIVAVSGDPVAFGLVASLHRPGGNLTGVAFFFAEICAKRVELIKEAIPSLSRIAVFFNPTSSAASIPLAAMQRTASALNGELLPHRTDSERRHRRFSYDGGAAGSGASRHQRATDYVEREKDCGLRVANQIANDWVQAAGGSGSADGIRVNLVDLFARSASFVDKILKGTAPTDLPIERAVKFEVVVNLKSAKTLGIELPHIAARCAPTR